MNIKMKSIAAVVALTAAAFAAEPAAPVASSVPATESSAAPAAAPAAQESAPAESFPLDFDSPAPNAATSPASNASGASASEPATVNAAESVPAEAPVAAPEADASAVSAAEASEESAPVAVRGEDATAEPPAAPTAEVDSASTESAPVAVRENEMPVTMYVVPNSRGGRDTVTLDQLRGLVPMQFTVGIQGFIGYYTLTGDNDHYSFDEYDGMTWRAGAFALIPLNEYTMGFKVGVYFERSSASNSYWGTFNEKYDDWHVDFVQSKINIPILFSLKHPKSSFMFDFGVQPSFAVMDDFKLKVSSDDNLGGKRDMMKHDYRNSIDWSIVMGLSIRANQYVGFDFRFDWGFSDLYDYFKEWKVDDLTSHAFMLGFSFYFK